MGLCTAQHRTPHAQKIAGSLQRHYSFHNLVVAADAGSCASPRAGRRPWLWLGSGRVLLGVEFYFGAHPHPANQSRMPQPKGRPGSEMAVKKESATQLCVGPGRAQPPALITMNSRPPPHQTRADETTPYQTIPHHTPISPRVPF